MISGEGSEGSLCKIYIYGKARNFVASRAEGRVALKKKNTTCAV